MEPIEVEPARRMVLARAAPQTPETVPLVEALGRWLAADVVAGRTHPAADNSAMDGYAVRAADVAAASAASPVVLRVVGTSAAGRPAETAVSRGKAVRIFTGGVIPAGADCVVVQEATTRLDDQRVAVRAPSPPGRHIRCAGEEYRVGDVLLTAGDRLLAAGIGLLASSGISAVRVHRRPRVALLVTGDELLGPDAARDAPGVIDTNGPMLEACCRAAGAEVVGRARRGDEPDALASWLDLALGTADVVLTSGGASVGDTDLIAEAWERCGVATEFWQVAMKPGKPVRFGCHEVTGRNVLAFALPGNPLAALTGFEQFVEPALVALSGGTWRPHPRLRLPLAEEQTASGARTYFLRAGLSAAAEPELVVPARQGAAMLREAARQPCVAHLPGPRILPRGRPVEAAILPHALAGGLYRPVPPLPPACGIWGPSDGGKTRLVEQLLPLLRGRSLRVGTIKHATHPPALDQDGKDTARHAAAGAECVALVGPGRAAWFVHVGAADEVWPWLEAFAGRVDLVLVEGFHEAELPGIWIAVEPGAPFAVSREPGDGEPRWRLTRPEVEGDRLDFPAELLAELAAALVEALGVTAP